MFYQKCSACHSEWNAIKMVIECPFCGNAFEMQNSNFKSVEDTFRYIICTHGFEIIKQKSTFVSLLADYAPTLEKERRVVKMALEAGVYLELMSVSKTDESEQSAAQAKAINKLNKDYLLDQVWAKQAVLWFVSQLGWSSQLKEVSKKIVPATSVSTPQTNTVHPVQSPVNTIIRGNGGLSIGDKVEFGSYPYEKDGTKKKISWEILDINDGKVLLWADMCLDVHPYHHIRKKCDWVDADLRVWIRDKFTNIAFQNEERLALQNVEIATSKNPKTGRGNGNATRGSVFILSNEEFDRYKLRDFQLRATATPYAIKQGIFCTADSDAYYWVRTPGTDELTQMFIGKAGTRNEGGNYMDQKGRGIRPAVWVDYLALKRLSKK